MSRLQLHQSQKLKHHQKRVPNLLTIGQRMRSRLIWMKMELNIIRVTRKVISLTKLMQKEMSNGY